MSALPNADETRVITMTETGHIGKKHIYKNMKKKFSGLLIGFGAAQITIGFICLVLNGITIGIIVYGRPHTDFPILAHGVFPGATFMVAGAMGMAAGKGKKKCLVVSSNVLCIISASLCFYLFVCSVISASAFGSICYGRYEGYGTSRACPLEKLETVLAILAFVELGCAIGSSIVCCSMGACCCDCRSCLSENMTEKATGIPYQQPANLVLNPSQPSYYVPGANQMTIPFGQQQPVILLNPSQMMAQYNPQQMSASANWGNSGMNSSTGEDVYEPLTRGMPVPMGHR